MKPKHKTPNRTSKTTSKPKPSSSKPHTSKPSLLQKQDSHPSTTRLPSKPKINIKPLVLNPNSAAYNIQQRRKFLKQNPSNRHSVSSKEDFGKGTINKLTLTKNALTSKYSLTSSNKQSECTLKSIQQLGEMFRTSNLKRTIIIDNEGNTNLHFNFNKLYCKDDKNKTEINKEVQQTQYTSEKITENYIDEKEKEGEMPLFVVSNENNTENAKKEQLVEEENRMKEYGMIFNLLNNNIEQMKNLFNNNEGNVNNSNKKVMKIKKRKSNSSISKCRDVYPEIITSKDREEIEKVQKMENTNCNESCGNGQYNNEQLNNNGHQHNSFLESCIHEDFFQSFANVTPHNMNSSFDFSSMLNINNGNGNTDDISNLFSGLDQTECEYDEKNNNVYLLGRNSLNPHFLNSSKQKMKNPFVKYSQFRGSGNLPYRNDDKKCTLF